MSNQSANPPQKKFNCTLCQRKFNRREHLQRHERIHYGHKPFNCTYCGYSCRRRDLLNRHIKLTHSKDTSEGHSRNAPLSPNTRSSISEPQSIPPQSEVDQASATVPPPTILDNTESNPQPLDFNFLDSVTLPLFVGQPASYPEFSLNDQFGIPPIITDTDQLGDPNASHHEQQNINPVLTERIPHPGPQPAGPPPDSEPERHHTHLATFLRVSQSDWHWLFDQVSRFSSILPADYELPSRHAISRYLHGFMNGFHPHFPIIHAQTLSLRGMTPELTLALAAVGSHYCLEPHQGLKLYALARAVAMERIRRRDADKDSRLLIPRSPWFMVNTPTSLSDPNAHGRDELPPEEPSRNNQDGHMLVETMQALFFLMAMTTWGGEHRSFVRQAIAMQSVLAMLVREHGLVESNVDPLTWEEWARMESARRTKLIIFCFFNLHTITFNLPSPFMIADIQLRLPCTELEWKAPNPASWVATHEKSQCPPLFQDCIAELIKESETPIPVCSSLGSHILIHALLQRIFSIQQAIQLESMENEMVPGLSRTLRRALMKWHGGWESNPESSLSPLDKHGPIAFNSTALFHLAHVRLITNIGPARSLLEQSSIQIAQKLCDQPAIPRGSMLTLAARHARLIEDLKTAALCPPVQMGIYFVGTAPTWSVMHAVCSLEYAYILNQFLQATTAPDLEYPLEPEEQALLTAIKETLREVESSTPQGNPKIVDAMPQLLGVSSVRAWGLILQGMRTWNAVDLITRALFTYADSLELRVCQP